VSSLCGENCVSVWFCVGVGVDVREGGGACVCVCVLLRLSALIVRVLA
jgi:hypothetical protein